MFGWRWIALALLPLAAALACDDDVDANGSMHAALHGLAHEACEEIEAAAESYHAAAIARALAEGKDLGASPDEVLEILGEECPDLLPPSE